MRKINELYTKTQLKLTKVEEKNTEYEKKMNSVIESRVGDVIK